MPEMKTEQPNAADKALRDDILALVRRHLFPNTKERILAIASQVVGQVLALQDPRTLGKEGALAIIQANIEQGNHDYVNMMLAGQGKDPEFRMN